MSFTLMAMVAAVATHSVQIYHGGIPVQANYTARAEIRTKTVGAKTPNRMDLQRCHWTATIVVDRALNHTPALARTVSNEKTFSGSEHGACLPSRNIAERHLTQHKANIHDHLTKVAEGDRAPLLAELDAVRNLASN